MEHLVLPLIIVAVGLLFWLSSGGPENVAREHRLAEDAKATAEVARTEQAQLALERSKFEHEKTLA